MSVNVSAIQCTQDLTDATSGLYTFPAGTLPPSVLYRYDITNLKVLDTADGASLDTGRLRGSGNATERQSGPPQNLDRPIHAFCVWRIRTSGFGRNFFMNFGRPILSIPDNSLHLLKGDYFERGITDPKNLLTGMDYYTVTVDDGNGGTREAQSKWVWGRDNGNNPPDPTWFDLPGVSNGSADSETVTVYLQLLEKTAMSPGAVFDYGELSISTSPSDPMAAVADDTVGEVLDPAAGADDAGSGSSSGRTVVVVAAVASSLLVLAFLAGLVAVLRSRRRSGRRISSHHEEDSPAGGAEAGGKSARAGSRESGAAAFHGSSGSATIPSEIVAKGGADGAAGTPHGATADESGVAAGPMASVMSKGGSDSAVRSPESVFLMSFRSVRKPEQHRGIHSSGDVSLFSGLDAGASGGTGGTGGTVGTGGSGQAGSENVSSQVSLPPISAVRVGSRDSRIAAFIPGNVRLEPSAITLGHVLGRGAFGNVYEGRYSGSDVAVKIVPCSTGEEVEHMENEISLMCSARHPNVVLLIGYFERGNEIGIVMERLEESLDSFVQRSGPLPARDALAVALGVARGVAYLHARSIVHRDLKPGNVMLSDQGIPRVVDFGVSKRVSDNSSMRTTAGTLVFMAPEVIRGERCDSKVDVYSFGIMIYYVAAGRPPYVDSKVPALIAYEVAEQGLRPEWPDGIDPRLRSVAERCWSEQPADRPSFEELVREIEMLWASVHGQE